MHGMDATGSRKVVVALSRCHGEAYRRRAKQVEGLGGKVLKRERCVRDDAEEARAVWSQVTHCIQAVPDEYTLQDMACASLGKWLVPWSWLDQSVAAGHWLPETGTRRPPLDLSGKSLYVTTKFMKRESKALHWAKVFRLLFEMCGGEAKATHPEATHLLVSSRDDPGWYVGLPGTRLDAVALTILQFVRWVCEGGDAESYGYSVATKVHTGVTLSDTPIPSDLLRAIHRSRNAPQKAQKAQKVEKLLPHVPARKARTPPAVLVDEADCAARAPPPQPLVPLCLTVADDPFLHTPPAPRKRPRSASPSGLSPGPVFKLYDDTPSEGSPVPTVKPHQVVHMSCDGDIREVVVLKVDRTMSLCYVGYGAFPVESRWVPLTDIAALPSRDMPTPHQNHPLQPHGCQGVREICPNPGLTPRELPTLRRPSSLSGSPTSTIKSFLAKDTWSPGGSGPHPGLQGRSPTPTALRVALAATTHAKACSASPSHAAPLPPEQLYSDSPGGDSVSTLGIASDIFPRAVVTALAFDSSDEDVSY
eukprot:Sspe_Gene.118882::Locus_113430_Transcript_1_1_Confidence_1.000_Length_1680::g.118882::m.118882